MKKTLFILDIKGRNFVPFEERMKMAKQYEEMLKTGFLVLNDKELDWNIETVEENCEVSIVDTDKEEM